MEYVITVVKRAYELGLKRKEKNNNKRNEKEEKAVDGNEDD